MEAGKTDPILSVKHLSLEFDSGDGRFTALDDINFELFPGESIAIVGESGAGKSLLARCILRLLDGLSHAHIEGSVVLNLEDVHQDLITISEAKMRRIRGSKLGLIFQEPRSALNPAKRCGSNVRSALRFHFDIGEEEARKRCRALFELVGLEDPMRIERAFPSELSGGQLQRVMVAMAIAAQPDVLIADEPTSSLDAIIRRKVIQGLQSHSELERTSVVYITHDLQMARELANRVIVMYAGKIVEQGAVEEVYKNPQHPYTSGLINCSPPSDKRYYFLPTIDDFMRVSESGTEFERLTGISEVFDHMVIKKGARKLRHQEIYSHQPILRVHSVAKQYVKSGLLQRTRVFEALDDISFDVYSGETLGIVGISGSGKTTLAKIMVGLSKPKHGFVEFLDRERDTYVSLTDPKEIGRHVQYVFQDAATALNPGITIGQALMEPLELLYPNESSEELHNRVLEVLAQVGLKPQHYDRFPHELSGGQRQRINIARALLPEPKILVCDEPVASLDVSVQASVLNLLNELKYGYNMSLVLIAHDLNLVRFMSDRMLVMHEGKIVEEGDADRIYSNPTHQQGRNLLGKT